MLITTGLYQHNFLNTLVQITEQQGNWVEFIEKDTNTIRWLESVIFDHAYEYYNEGDPIVLNLAEARAQAQSAGILVPREFLTK